jgi:hypothetical protein
MPGVKIFPAGPVPANLLRWHFVFDSPVDTVAAEDGVSLLDDRGKPVPHVFVELPDGLWDDSGTRLTLLLHPGRIKSGLRVRVHGGSALAAGERMTLRLDLDRIIGAGAGFVEHRFTVVPAIERPVDLAKWRLGDIEVGRLDPLTIQFDRPMDRFSLEGAMALVGPSGEVLDGIDSIDADGCALAFTPSLPWQSGAHRLVVAPDLEDLAGNRVDAAFESPLRANLSQRWERTFDVRERPTALTSRARERSVASRHS